MIRYTLEEPHIIKDGIDLDTLLSKPEFLYVNISELKMLTDGMYTQEDVLKAIDEGDENAPKMFEGGFCSAIDMIDWIKNKVKKKGSENE